MHRRLARFTLPFALAAAGLSLGCGGHKASKPASATTTGAVTSSGTGPTTSGSTGNAPAGSALAAAPSLAVTEAKPGADVVVLAVRVQAQSADVELRALTLTASGSADESTLGGLKLIGDDDGDGAIGTGEPTLVSVAAPAFPTDDGSVTVTLTQPVTIAAGQALNLLAALEVQATGQAAAALVGKTLEVKIAQAADLDVAIQAQTVTPSGSFPLGGGAVTLFIHDHLLLSEIVPQPNGGEYVEIFNPTAQTIDLSDVYLTDATDGGVNWYYKLPTGQGFAVTTSDFLVRFPASSAIQPGQTITVAMDGAGFQVAYTKDPDYYLRNPSATGAQMLRPDAAVPPNWSATQAGTGVGLTNGGEPVILFRWDGTSDLIQDIDYVYYGTETATNTRIDKSSAQVDGPDADTTPTAFQPEIAAFQQKVLAVAAAPNHSLIRVDFSETGESLSGGNGVTGHDETAEAFDTTWMSGPPTPGVP